MSISRSNDPSSGRTANQISNQTSYEPVLMEPPSQSDSKPIEAQSFVPESIQVFNESNFYGRFLEDVRNAKALVILQSPYITHNRWSQLSSDFRACVDRHVCVCVFLQDQGDCAEFQNCLVHLKNAGVHINVKPAIHEKVAVIDEQVLWDGSLNVLSHRNTRERMSRIVSKDMAISAMVEHGLNRCETCAARRNGRTLDGGTATAEEQLELIGRRIKRHRLASRMTQRQLAMSVGVCQQTISHLENGSLHNISFRVICAVCHNLDLEMRLVPRFFLQILDDRLAD